MKLNWKKSYVVLFIVILGVLTSLLLNISALANGVNENQRVFDHANLFEESQISILEEYAEEFAQEMSAHVLIVTTDDTGGRSARDFADEFYDEQFGVGTNDSGVLFLIDMDNREVYIMTAGKMILYLTDQRIESILDQVMPEMRNENYGMAASRFLDEMIHYYRRGIVDGQYMYNEETGRIIRYRRPFTWQELSIIALGSALVGYIFYKSVVWSYGRISAPAFAVREKGRIKLTKKEDIYLTKNVTRARLPELDDTPSSGSSRNGGSSSSGRSTTHTTSSGATRGGGGRGF